MIEKAASLWGKAGQRSLELSALAEAAEQLRRALDQIATLPATTELRREQIEVQVALITPLIHVKGYAAPETKAATEQARQLIEQAEALGEPPDPLLSLSVLYAFSLANAVAFNGDALGELSTEFFARAEKEGTAVPLMLAHRLMGTFLLLTGDIAGGRAHYDKGIALYDAATHRPLAMRFGQDTQVAAVSYRSLVFWILGYPDAALADSNQAISEAREIGQAPTLMFALHRTSLTNIQCGNYSRANELLDELTAGANKRAALFWKAFGMMNRGCLFSLTGKASDAVQVMMSGITVFRSTGSTLWMPFFLTHLAMAFVELHELEDAWRCIREAMATLETTKERWCEAEVHRTAGEMTRLAPNPDAAKAEAHFQRALAVAREQQARSWELRAAMSMARLWRYQGRTQQALELLAPIYGWFTEGFDTRDLKDAKVLLKELQSAQRARAAPPACRTHH
jgi:predicted ATPase